MCHMPTLTPGATVAVIGAGAMGAGIAQVAASAGHPVALVDAMTGAAEEAVARIIGSLQRQEAKGRISSAQLEETVERITCVDAVGQLPPSGLVIEAVREDLDTKRRLFAQLAQTQGADTVLATNTSSLDIDGHRRRPAGARAGHRAALLQPAARHAPGRGRPGPRVRDVRARGRGRPDARLGQDARALRLHARLHRQPRGATVLRRGPADARWTAWPTRPPSTPRCAPPASAWARSS